MESQLKRGLIEICVLAAIRKQDSYGYQIIKDISPYLSISESTLYPILKRLESNGNLTVYSIEHNGRLRKYYLPFMNRFSQTAVMDFVHNGVLTMH